LSSIQEISDENSLSLNVLVAQQIQNNQIQNQLKQLQRVQSEIVKALSNMAKQGLGSTSQLDIMAQNSDTYGKNRYGNLDDSQRFKILPLLLNFKSINRSSLFKGVHLYQIFHPLMIF